jgi:thiol:disulfide interchange protein DsbC
MTKSLKTLLSTLVAAVSISLLVVTPSHADVANSIDKIRVELVKLIPSATGSEILATDAKNVFRIALQGSYAYAYVDGDLVLIGDLLNTATKENLGDIARAEKTAEKIANVPVDKMIVYGPKDAKRHITVFTDIDCGYCRKLHLEVPELTAAGVQVRYLAFPRSGINTPSFNKYVSVWCNDDQQASLTTAKTGGSVPVATCSNPIAESYNLGREVGVTGTPTIIFDDGTLTPGYVPYATLLERMGVKKDS